jgi:hypothetical protein
MVRNECSWGNDVIQHIGNVVTDSV